MIFTYLGKSSFYGWLRWRLGTTDAGTPCPNIKRLRSWQLSVDQSAGNIDTLRTSLEAGIPIIVPVAAEILPHWIRRSDLENSPTENNHVVVVVGLDEQNIYINDPDFDDAPQTVEIDWFLAAWQFHQYRCAVL